MVPARSLTVTCGREPPDPPSDRLALPQSGGMCVVVAMYSDQQVDKKEVVYY